MLGSHNSCLFLSSCPLLAIGILCFFFLFCCSVSSRWLPQQHCRITGTSVIKHIQFVFVTRPFTTVSKEKNLQKCKVWESSLESSDFRVSGAQIVMFLALFLKPSFIICCCAIDFAWLHCFISTLEIFSTTCPYQSSAIITSGLVGISVERVHSHLLQEPWQRSAH